MRTMKAAESIVKQIIKSANGYCEDPPTIKTIDGMISIVWEGGPFEWATNDNYGLFEELKSLGMPGEYKYKAYWQAPKGILVEAINSYSVAVCQE